MPNTLITFERDFQIWKYTVGHAQLLLRSTKPPKCPTRIDVFFKNVGAIHVPTSFKQLSIIGASAHEAVKMKVLDCSSVVGGHRKLFLIRGSDFEGYVVAGIVVWHEDQGEYHEPSYFAKNNIL